MLTMAEKAVSVHVIKAQTEEYLYFNFKIHSKSNITPESYFMKADLNPANKHCLYFQSFVTRTVASTLIQFWRQDAPDNVTCPHLSYTSMSIIRGTPRATIVLCTCIVLARSLHAFISNWRTRNAKTLIKESLT